MRKLRATSILSDADVRLILSQMEEILPAVFQTGAATGFDVEATVRFSAVAAKCRESRENRGMTLKEAAAALRVPQYRLRAIESGSRSSFDTHVLEGYITHLGLKSWFGRWKRANPTLASELGLSRSRARQ